MLGPKSKAAANGPSPNGKPAPKDPNAREPIDLIAYPRIAEELLDVSNDRSKDSYRIGCAVRDYGLTLEHFRWAIDQRSDLAGRIGKRRDDDVLRIWERVCDEWHAQAPQPQAAAPGSQQAPGGAAPPPPSAAAGGGGNAPPGPRQDRRRRARPRRPGRRQRARPCQHHLPALAASSGAPVYGSAISPTR